MLSIIIPIFNQQIMTEQCIESIKDNTEDYELIIVDNGSDPVFEKNTIRNTENLGFPKAVNQGIRASRGDIICLLNNDTVVTPGWAEGLKKRLDDGYSIAGPMTNYVAGCQRAVAGVYEDEVGLNHAAAEWSETHHGITQEVNFVIGFCLMFKKPLYDELGDFDESMWPCSGEEIDFCLSARKAGHHIGIAQDVYIHHYGSQTFGDMQSAGVLDYKETCRKCDAHLAEKWGDNFWQKQDWVSKESAIRLNLGCGNYPLKGFTNVDKYENVHPDLVSNALGLPYESETVTEIYCGHMLEHLTLEEGRKALRYWKSLLIPGGKITVTVPDFDYLVKLYLEDPTPENLIKLNEETIYSYCQESHHQYCYSGDLLKKVMASAGFVSLEKLPVDHEYFANPVLWQVAYSGRKA